MSTYTLLHSMVSLNTDYVPPLQYIHELIHKSAAEETVQQILDGQLQVPALSSGSGLAVGSVNVTTTAEASHSHVTSLKQVEIAPNQSSSILSVITALYQPSLTKTGTGITSITPSTGSSPASSATLSAITSIIPFKTVVSESKSSVVDRGDVYADLSGCGNRHINCGARSGIGLK